MKNAENWYFFQSFTKITRRMTHYLNFVKKSSVFGILKCLFVKEVQLSSDYIERYLGKLDMMQESKLVQLRRGIEELRGSSVPADTTLLRFLRAREFNVEKAKEMLTQSLHWRKKYQIDKLLDEYEAPQVVKEYFPGGWHHFDKGESIKFLTKIWNWFIGILFVQRVVLFTY